MFSYYSLYPSIQNGVNTVWTAEWKRGFPSEISVSAQSQNPGSALSEASAKKSFVNINNPIKFDGATTGILLNEQDVSQNQQKFAATKAYNSPVEIKIPTATYQPVNISI